MELNQDLHEKPSFNLGRSSSFFLHNGFDHINNDQDSQNDAVKISDVEMITIRSYSYTSLKDILPPSPSSVLSPINSSSWSEQINIKNPLVKQAALAYLQPMGTPLETGEKGFFGRLKEGKCSGCFGFVSWFREVVFRAFKGVVVVDEDGGFDGDFFEDDCEEEDDHEKVY